MMNKYINYLATKAQNNILTQGLGDWYDLGPDLPGFSQLTPAGVTATAIYFYDLVLMSKMAGLMNRENEKLNFEDLSKEVKKSFNNKFFNPETGVYATGSQTSMAMPLCLGLVDESYKIKVLNNLVDSIKSNNLALTTGDIGFHYLIQTLTDNNYSQLIYNMNNRDDVPGYGYQIKKGATALTESWEALPVKSNNHLMLGHIMQWFYEGLGGIGQEENSVAYKNIIIKPEFVNGIDSVKVIFHSPYGIIGSEWKRSEKSIQLKVNIPVNTTAKIIVPSSDGDVLENGKPVKNISELHNLKLNDDKIEITISSGEYFFTFNL